MYCNCKIERNKKPSSNTVKHHRKNFVQIFTFNFQVNFFSWLLSSSNPMLPFLQVESLVNWKMQFKSVSICSLIPIKIQISTLIIVYGNVKPLKNSEIQLPCETLQVVQHLALLRYIQASCKILLNFLHLFTAIDNKVVKLNPILHLCFHICNATAWFRQEILKMRFTNWELPHNTFLVRHCPA